MFSKIVKPAAYVLDVKINTEVNAYLLSHIQTEFVLFLVHKKTFYENDGMYNVEWFDYLGSVHIMYTARAHCIWRSYYVLDTTTNTKYRNIQIGFDNYL